LETGPGRMYLTKTPGPHDKPRVKINKPSKRKFMQIIISKLSLRNFKGIRDLDVTFGEITNVAGANATGKTTLKDAFLWLLFGKDSTGRSDFQIKTLDANNEPLHHLDHEVTGLINFGSESILLRKIYREKWTKVKGRPHAEFSGHTTEFFWNDVPMKEKDYQAAISKMITETLFRLLTDTNFFQTLPKGEQRSQLLAIAGEITMEEVANQLSQEEKRPIELAELKKALSAGKTLDQYRDEIKSKIKALQTGGEYQARIDELNKSLLSFVPWDYDHEEKLLADHLRALDDIDRLLMDRTAAETHRQEMILAKSREVMDMKIKAQGIEFDLNQKLRAQGLTRGRAIQDKKTERRVKVDERARLIVDISTDEGRIQGWEVVKSDLLNKWKATNSETLEFKDGDLACPTCHRPLDSEVIISKKFDMTKSFNADKTRRLADIDTQGKKVSGDIKATKESIATMKAKKETLDAEITLLDGEISNLEINDTNAKANEELEIQKLLNQDTELLGLKEMIRLGEEELNAPPPAGTDALARQDLLNKKSAINLQIKQSRELLADKVEVEKITARITELKAKELDFAEKIMYFEGLDFAIEQFNRKKMEILESRVNDKFKLVSFKLFEKQVNGGLADVCVTLIGGVPYSDANTASKVAAGLDIINTLSEFYGITAPVWIDNRESVINIPETRSQIINLIVREGVDSLKILRMDKVVETN
jgi:cell division protein FtsB